MQTGNSLLDLGPMGSDLKDGYVCAFGNLDPQGRRGAFIGIIIVQSFPKFAGFDADDRVYFWIKVSSTIENLNADDQFFYGVVAASKSLVDDVRQKTPCTRRGNE